MGWRAHAGSDLLVILGKEATTLTGRWLAVGIQPGQVARTNYLPVPNYTDVEQVLWASLSGHTLLVANTKPYPGERRAFFLLGHAGPLTRHRFTPLSIERQQADLLFHNHNGPVRPWRRAASPSQIAGRETSPLDDLS